MESVRKVSFALYNQSSLTEAPKCKRHVLEKGKEEGSIGRKDERWNKGSKTTMRVQDN